MSNWQPISTCPADKEVWLFSSSPTADHSLYPGKEPYLGHKVARTEDWSGWDCCQRMRGCQYLLIAWMEKEESAPMPHRHPIFDRCAPRIKCRRITVGHIPKHPRGPAVPASPGPGRRECT